MAKLLASGRPSLAVPLYDVRRSLSGADLDLFFVGQTREQPLTGLFRFPPLSDE